jgi:hypothetical protein
MPWRSAAKLAVSQSSDKYEQKADRMADAVMHREQQGSAGGIVADAVDPSTDAGGRGRNDATSFEEFGSKTINP